LGNAGLSTTRVRRRNSTTLVLLGAEERVFTGHHLALDVTLSAEADRIHDELLTTSVEGDLAPGLEAYFLTGLDADITPGNDLDILLREDLNMLLLVPDNNDLFLIIE
jgi:hypothetical protein